MNISHNKIRIESDALGEVSVPSDAYFGPQTARALANFQISGSAIGDNPALIRALAWVKKAAALANMQCGEISEQVAHAICEACDEISAGEHLEQFCVDSLQGGAGTSTNMNANEVIANRAIELLGGERGNYSLVHPVDHVNRSQSTNDAYATATRLAVVVMIEDLSLSVQSLIKALVDKGSEFARVTKLGRTQLQDAVPISAGSEFDAFASALETELDRLGDQLPSLLSVNLGGTAVGTGIGASEGYRKIVVEILEQVSGLPVRAAPDPVVATTDMGAFVAASASFKGIALKLSKICNDLRLLASGPAGGLAEISLPPRQPGSSIMPGKVNPVIPEAVNQVCFRVIGNDVTIGLAAEAGQLQLNAFGPLIVCTLSESASLLGAASKALAIKCVEGIELCDDRCALHLQESTAIAVLLAQIIGYDEASRLAKEAHETNTPFLSVLAPHSRAKPEIAIFLSRHGS